MMQLEPCGATPVSLLCWGAGATLRPALRWLLPHIQVSSRGEKRDFLLALLSSTDAVRSASPSPAPVQPPVYHFRSSCGLPRSSHTSQREGA